MCTGKEINLCSKWNRELRVLNLSYLLGRMSGYAENKKIRDFCREVNYSFSESDKMFLDLIKEIVKHSIV